MSDTPKYVAQLQDLKDRIREFGDQLNEAPWKMGEVLDSYQSLFNRFCPFKEGDRVEICRPIDTNNGWKGFKYYLVMGSPGTVHSRGYRDGKFTFSVVMDFDSSYLSTGGWSGTHPSITASEYKYYRPSHFTFSESTLRASNKMEALFHQVADGTKQMPLWYRDIAILGGWKKQLEDFEATLKQEPQ